MNFKTSMLAVSFLFATVLNADPIYFFRISNPRNNTLELLDNKAKANLDIPPGHFRDFAGLFSEEWQVRYQSGVSGAFAYNLDQPINNLVYWCKNVGDRHLSEDTVKVCTFALSDEGFTTYTLEQRDTKVLREQKDFGVCPDKGYFVPHDTLKLSAPHDLKGAPDVRAAARCLFET